ncbi:MAG: BatA domain-containing protein [Flammeovirgaceae bacterium]
MNFLFPLYLYGLGLLAIPIIIHFFNFQRAKRVYFTNVAFLKTVKEVTNSRNKLKNLLVLLARLLFLLFLVLAFARPYLPNDNVSDGESLASGKYVSIYLDNSYSMQNEQDGKRLYDLGINYADQISQAFPKSVVYQLLDNTFESNMSYFSDKDRLSEKLSLLDFCNIGRQLNDVYIRQLDAIQANTSGKGNHVFWITDFQKNNLPNLDLLELDSNQNHYLLPLIPNANTNLYVDSVWLETPFVKVQENSIINIKINNNGEEAVENKALKLYLGDNQVSSTTVNVPESGSQTVKLNFAVSEAGQKSGRISIEDFPVTFDNDYFFVLKVAPKINIVSVTENDNPFIREVFSNETFFEVQDFSINALDYTAVSNADLVVLSNLKEVDNALQVALQKAIANQASVVVFPNEQADLSSYMAGLQLNMQSKKFTLDGTPDGIAVPDARNPFFEGVFEKVQVNMSMPDAVPVVSWSAVGQSLLKFKSGQPFLSAINNGRSNVYIFATPLKLPFTNFPKHAIFVPIMYKIALSSKAESERLAYDFNEDLATVALEGVNKGDIFKLKNEEVEFIPSQRVVDNELKMNIPKTNMDANTYDIRNSQSDVLVGQVAFNYGPGESSLDYYTLEELKEHFKAYKNVQVFDALDPDRFAQTFQNQNVSKPLWRYAVALALLFLLAEILLIRFWKT